MPEKKSIYVSGNCLKAKKFTEVEAIYEKFQPPGYEFPIGFRVSTICNILNGMCNEDCPIGNQIIYWDD